MVLVIMTNGDERGAFSSCNDAAIRILENPVFKRVGHRMVWHRT